MNILGVILAGGQSRRMGGGHKGLIKLRGQSLCSHVIDRFNSQVDSIILNVNTDKQLFLQYDLPLVSDSIDGFAGPLAGVLAGMDWASKNGYEYIVTAAADTPFFPLNLVKRLTYERKNNSSSIVLASTPDGNNSQSIHPTFGLWEVSLREDLRNSLNEGIRKMVKWTARHQSSSCLFTEGKFDRFFNINTPEDIFLAEDIIDKGWV